jgi:hypothetical protein
MTFKLHRVALAIAFVAAGPAHAAMDLMAANAQSIGNSSLAFVAYDRTGAGTGSFMADLAFNFNDFLPTSALAIESTVVWNFNTSSVSVNGGPAVTTGIDYSPFTQFFSAVQTSELRWGVIAGDAVQQRFLTTGAPSVGNLADTGTSRQTNQLTANMINADNLYLANNGATSNSTHGTAANGASFALASQSWYAPQSSTGFGTNGNWNNTLRWNAVLANGVASRFFLVDNSVSRGDAAAGITMFGNPDVFAPNPLPAIGPTTSTFLYDHTAGTLTWNGVAPIPEPGTYAMLLAGLAAVGFVARRRRAG